MALKAVFGACTRYDKDHTLSVSSKSRSTDLAIVKLEADQLLSQVNVAGLTALHVAAETGHAGGIC